MPPPRPTHNRPPGFVWWKHGVIYQIYPRSFQDSNGDGVGDLLGVISRLDYLAGLGVDAIWLSPIFSSPMADFGYDVSDYVAIDPLFGDLDTFQRLVDEAHGRGLKVILDYIPNHTSDQHVWFQESRRSRNDPRREWYIWRDGAPGGGPPNNWRSEFGGPAWTWDEAAGQYYYHAFLPSQPDLNWRNSAVVEAMLEVLAFWLDRGVDGFRVDAIHHLIERADLADNPVNPDWREGMAPAEQLVREHTIDQPEVHHAIAAMRALIDGYEGDRVLIGEAYLPISRLMAYYGAALAGFHLPFNFHLMTTPWTPAAIAGLISTYEASLPTGGWPNWVLSNHDRSRLATRLGRDQARVAAMLLLTLRGTPTLYQGDELGMTDVPIPPDRVLDPWELNVPGLGLGRDPVRTPMLWSGAANAGFGSAEPWLPLSPDWPEINVARQVEAPGSILRLYHALLDLRRREPALVAGDYAPRAATDALLAYERRTDADRLLVVLDLGGLGGEMDVAVGTVLLSTHTGRQGEPVTGRVRLSAHEGVVIRLGDQPGVAELAAILSP
jgi:alpha-glucosidase